MSTFDSVKKVIVEQLDVSQDEVSPQASFLACQYSEKGNQGLVVWRLLGGDHVFARGPREMILRSMAGGDQGEI